MGTISTTGWRNWKFSVRTVILRPQRLLVETQFKIVERKSFVLSAAKKSTGEANLTDAYSVPDGRESCIRLNYQ